MCPCETERAAAIRALDVEGIELDALTVREPSLDDVFLQLTGRTADEPTAGDG